MNKKLLAFFAFVLLMLVTLVIADVGGHLIYRVQNGQWLFCENEHFRVGFVEKVAQRRVYKLKAGFKDSLYTVGENSCRVVPEQSEKLRYACFLGDSVPFGSGVKDGQTYPFYFGRMLAQNKIDLGVINAGTPSYNLRQAFDRYRLDIKPRYDCDLVFLQSVNDISLLTQLGAEWNLDSTWAGAKWKSGKRYFSSLAFMLWGRLEQKNLKPYSSPEFIAAMKSMIAAEYARCELKGKTTVFLALNPFYYSDLKDERNSGLPDFSRLESYIKAWNTNVAALNAVLAEFAQQQPDVYFIPVNEIFDLSGKRDKYFVDFLHLSPEGNKYMAKQIFDFLRAAKLI